MPIYHNPNVFAQAVDPAFEQLLTPGTITPYSGIYRCDTCGYEAVSTKGHRLPPQHYCDQHHIEWLHCRPNWEVRWRLVAYAQHTRA